MSVRWIGILIFMALMIGIVGGIATGSDILNVSTDTGTFRANSDLNTLSNWQEVQTSQTFGITQVPGAVIGYFWSAFKTMAFVSNNPMATGSWVVLDWMIIGIPLAIFVFGIVLLFFSLFKGSLS
jgi:hypothetical protein